MKMKKENMAHIRERFEKQTGTALPEKENLALPNATGHLIAVAAGLICIVGLGFAWHRIGAGKQHDVDMFTSAEGVTADTTLTEDEQETVTDTSGVVTEEITKEEALTPEEEALRAEKEALIAELEKIQAEKKALIAEEEKIRAEAEAVDGPPSVTLCTQDEAISIFNNSIFGDDAGLIWPVPATAGSTNGSEAPSVPFLIPSNDNSYISFPGSIGDEVVAMHACVVTETGFDTDRGYYVTTGINGNFLEYRHLDAIKVSEGDSLNAGDSIGTLGNSGRSTGPHLGIAAIAADGTVLYLLSLPAQDESSD